MASLYPGTGWGQVIPTTFPHPASQIPYAMQVAQRQALLGLGQNLSLGQAARLYNLNNILGTPQPARVLTMLGITPTRAGGITSTGHSTPSAVAHYDGPMVQVSSGSGTGFGGFFVPAAAPISLFGFNGGHGSPPAPAGITSGGGYDGSPLSHGLTTAPINAPAGIVHVPVASPGGGIGSTYMGLDPANLAVLMGGSGPRASPAGGGLTISQILNNPAITSFFTISDYSAAHSYIGPDPMTAD